MDSKMTSRCRKKTRQTRRPTPRRVVVKAKCRREKASAALYVKRIDRREGADLRYEKKRKY